MLPCIMSDNQISLFNRETREIAMFITLVVITFGYVGQGYVVRELNLARWMTELPEAVRDRSILEVAIPGSHDSFSYVCFNISFSGQTCLFCIKS